LRFREAFFFFRVAFRFLAIMKFVQHFGMSCRQGAGIIFLKCVVILTGLRKKFEQDY